MGIITSTLSSRLPSARLTEVGGVGSPACRMDLAVQDFLHHNKSSRSWRYHRNRTFFFRTGEILPGFASAGQYEHTDDDAG